MDIRRGLCKTVNIIFVFPLQTVISDRISPQLPLDFGLGLILLMTKFTEVYQQFMVIVCSSLEGGSVYLMNCTSDPVNCDRHNVSGFPTLVVFRGLGWLYGDQCVTPEMPTRERYVQLNYHGALVVCSL